MRPGRRNGRVPESDGKRVNTLQTRAMVASDLYSVTGLWGVQCGRHWHREALPDRGCALMSCQMPLLPRCGGLIQPGAENKRLLREWPPGANFSPAARWFKTRDVESVEQLKPF
jgi:hypothetical protein